MLGMLLRIIYIFTFYTVQQSCSGGIYMLFDLHPPLWCTYIRFETPITIAQLIRWRATHDWCSITQTLKKTAHATGAVRMLAMMTFSFRSIISKTCICTPKQNETNQNGWINYSHIEIHVNCLNYDRQAWSVCVCVSVHVRYDHTTNKRNLK